MSATINGGYYAGEQADGTFAVGGIKLKRPFRPVRLGHFGFNFRDIERAVPFYTDLLGFDISDIRDVSDRLTPEQRARINGPPIGVFTRYGTDHHAMVLFNHSMRETLDPPGRWRPGVTVNQITWQCGSLAQISDAIKWFTARQMPLVRSGRDMPGSNWHTYLADPDGNVNELYYGMEQIGWNGHSKPWDMHDRAFRVAPDLPQISEYQEVSDALSRGVDVTSGYRAERRLPAVHDVEGILLPRPFKVVRLGPVRLLVEDMEASLHFYRDGLGLIPTEEIIWEGHRCVFLRANTEHHAMALYPLALRETLGLSVHTTCFSIGFQLASYDQLRAARDFLAEKGCTVSELPPELFPGIDYSFFVRDTEGHAIQLYYYMEQIGWDARPRPPEARRKVTRGEWPEVLEPLSDSFMGEPFLGPLG